MKPRTINTALLTASLALPAGVFAQAGNPGNLPEQPDTTQSQEEREFETQRESQWGEKQHHGSMSGEIKKISEDKLEQKITARTLLDKSVYDMEGNRVGEVQDFALGKGLPRELAQKLERKGSEAGMAAGQEESAGAEVSAETERSAEAEGSFGVQGSEQESEQELILFVRVGGTLGVGGDTVAIPASELDYDPQEERFTVSISQEEINAIAEGGDEPGASREVSAR